MQEIEIVAVTPDIAREWLLENTGNRPLKRAKIAQYARNMAGGLWRYTGEALKFSNTGRLIDGQNRLHAIIESQTTVSLLVVRGVDDEAQDVMDSGAPRRVQDALAFHGYKNPKDLGATVTTHRDWTEGNYRHCMTKPTGADGVTNAEAVQYADEHPGLVGATAWASNFKRALSLPIGAIATARYETTAIDADDADEFFGRVSGLRTKGTGDPVHTLIRRVSEMRERQQTIRSATALFMIFRSWNACRAGERLVKFQFGSDMRGWVQIPEPK